MKEYVVNECITKELFKNEMKQPTENKLLQSKNDIWKEIFTTIYCLEPLVYHGKKVVMINQIAEVFGISRKKLLYRFRKYKEKDYFKYGEDYYMFDLDWEKLETKNEAPCINFKTYFLTESGVQLFAKFLDDDNCFIDNKNQQQSLKPSIETILEIDSDGMVEAKKLYEFLELGENRFAEWIRTNIINNSFVEKNIDYFPLVYTKECNGKVNFIASLKLTANFAKKLSMQEKTERAKQAREYFEKLEQENLFKPSKTDTLKNVIGNKADLTVKEINMFGDTVIAAQDKNGVIWAGVNAFCQGIGLNKNERDRQVKNIKLDEVVNKGASNLTLPTNGGNQEVLCLQLDYIPLWLAKISITPNMKENNPELVDKLVKYQLKAKDVLAAAFLPEKYRVKTPKQHSEQYQTTKDKCYTSSTPIPKVKNKIAKVKKSNDWFYNNNHKIEKILDAFGWEHRYLYHIILKTIGKEYDLQAAKRIYEKEVGISVTYAMDLVEYFDELSKAATKILDKMMNGIDSVN